MALVKVMKAFGPRAWSAAPTLPVASRTFAAFEDRERGEEQVHFRREDEKLLRSLLAKVKKQADVAEGGADGAKSAEEQQLKTILGDKANPSTIEALIRWKHEM